LSELEISIEKEPGMAPKDLLDASTALWVYKKVLPVNGRLKWERSRST